MFYSTVTLGCVSCATLIPNCATCNSALTTAVCTLCSDPYYVSASNTCVLCDVTCTSCTGVGLCTTCANNLVKVGGDCVPNTAVDPTLFYNPATNSAVSCLTLLSDCTACTPSPLTCSACLSGTFVSGGVCLPCPTTCATCDALGCTGICPTGLTLNGTACICGTSCTLCQSGISNCISCTLSGGVADTCLVCMPGFYLSGNLCLACVPGCATCSDSTTCLTCLPTFQMVGSSCVCLSSLDLYQNGNVC